MSGVFSEGCFGETQFVGGEDVPRVINWFPCYDNHVDINLRIPNLISVHVIFTQSQNIRNYSGNRATMLVFEQNCVKDKCVRHVSLIRRFIFVCERDTVESSSELGTSGSSLKREKIDRSTVCASE